jgi:hypothetical protein
MLIRLFRYTQLTPPLIAEMTMTSTIILVKVVMTLYNLLLNMVDLLYCEYTA